MGETIVPAGFILIFLWGWRRVYLHIIRKNGRRLIAHMLGLLIALFPARFFVYAAFAIAPPEGADPVSDIRALMLCAIFSISIIGLCILTRKRPQAISVLHESQENLPSGENPPHCS